MTCGMTTCKNEKLGDRVKSVFSPEVILGGLLGSKHQLTNKILHMLNDLLAMINGWVGWVGNNAFLGLLILAFDTNNHTLLLPQYSSLRNLSV